MPADVSDIAAASRDVVVSTWSSAAIAARYPSSRDGAASPAPGYFDLIADAQLVANARGALIGTERRRFAVQAADIVWPVISTAAPAAQLLDAEQGANGTFIVARVEIDLEAEATSYELFG